MKLQNIALVVIALFTLYLIMASSKPNPTNPVLEMPMPYSRISDDQVERMRRQILKRS